MHPQINPFLLYEMMSVDEFKTIFDDLISQKVKYIFEENGNMIGMFKLVPLEHRTSHVAYLGGLAIDPVFGGKGYGYAMLSEILGFAKAKGILRVELSAATANEKAIRIYEKAGFQREGILRKYTYLKSENCFLDEVMMSWLTD